MYDSQWLKAHLRVGECEESRVVRITAEPAAEVRGRLVRVKDG